MEGKKDKEAVRTALIWWINNAYLPLPSDLSTHRHCWQNRQIFPAETFWMKFRHAFLNLIHSRFTKSGYEPFKVGIYNGHDRTPIKQNCAALIYFAASSPLP